MGDKAERAKALFLEGYNCTQAVVGAFAEEIGMDFDTAVRLASGFGGGMGRLRQVCGTVSGMVFVASAKLGYTDPKAKVEKKELYQEIQNGNWEEEGELEKYRELRALVENLNISTYFAAMGASNAFQLRGRLPDDKKNLLNTLDKIISEVSEEDLRHYRKNLRHL